MNSCTCARPGGFLIVVLAVVFAPMACDDASTGPTVPPPPPPVPSETVVISGTVIPMGGGNPPSASLRIYSAIDTVDTDVGPDGRFVASVSRTEGDSVFALIDAGGEETGYLPTYRAFAPTDTTLDLVALLIPDRFAVPTGDYAGQIVELSLQAAIAPENRRAAGGDGDFFRLSRLRRGSADPFDLAEDIAPARSIWTNAWAPARLPLPLYFEHDGINLQGQVRGPITAGDSITIWSAIDDLESRVGLDLFVPTVKAAVAVDTIVGFDGPLEVRPFSVALEMVPTLAGPGAIAGFATIDYGCRSGNGDACERFGEGELFQSRVTLSALQGTGAAQSSFLVQHEMVHALGFGHACFRPSVMAACGGPYQGVTLAPGDPNPLTTVFDVAYIRWYQAIHDATFLHRPHFGIVEALDGERLVRLGRAPVSSEVRCIWGEDNEVCRVPPPIPTRMP